METVITEIPTTKKLPKLLRVAAYTRVSANKDEAYHSLSAQVGYYNNFISSHKGWFFVGVYSDEDRTGTKSQRRQMLYSYGSFLSKITLSLLCIVAPVPYVSINP